MLISILEMNMQTGTEFFIYFIFPQLIFFIGIIGNLLGLMVMVMSSKRLEKMGPRYIFRYLLIIDSIYLLTYLKSNLQTGFGIDLTTKYSFICKTYTYCLNAVASIPPMLLCYVSVERFICLNFPDKKVMLRNYCSGTMNIKFCI